MTLGSRMRGWRQKQKRPQLDLAPDAERLPGIVEHRESAGKAIRVSILAVVLAGASALFAWMWHQMPTSAIFGVAAVFSAVWAVHCWVFRRRWHFTQTQVECRQRGLLGRREWREPLSSYEGVLAMEMHPRSGDKATTYVLRLKHRDRKRRSVRLYVSTSPDGLRAKHEHYARLFGLPALTETKDGVEVRRLDELDKSVRERVAGGTLRTAFDPASVPPGKALAFHIGEDGLKIRTRGGVLGSTERAVAVLMLLAGPLIRVLMWLWEVDAPIFPPLLVVPSSLAGVLPLLADVLCVEEVSVSPKEVRHRLQCGRMSFRRSAISADEVEEVVVRQMPRHRWETAVQAIGDEGSVDFGRGLPRAQQDWVRDCIIAVISEDA